MLGKDAVDHLQAVPQISRALRRRPVLDHRPVDVGEHQLARAVHPAGAGADPAGECLAGWYSAESRPRQQGPPLVQGLIADGGEQPRPDALAPVILSHEQVALHDSRIACSVRPAIATGRRRAVGRLGEPGVVVELGRQLPGERDVGRDWL